jgi:probable rRNA maturation factor
MKRVNGISIIQSKQARVGFSTGAFLTLAKKIMKDLAPNLLKQSCMLEIVWVSDKKIKQLNAQYRKKNEKTDILSFSYLNSLSKKQVDQEPFGQLIISVDTLRRQARQYQLAYYQEAEILFVHGLLHVLGYDHQTKKEFKQMMQLEQRYLGDKSGLVGRSVVE